MTWRDARIEISASYSYYLRTVRNYTRLVVRVYVPTYVSRITYVWCVIPYLPVAVVNYSYVVEGEYVKLPTKGVVFVLYSLGT